MSLSTLFLVIAIILFIIAGFVFTGILHLAGGALAGGFGWSVWGLASLVISKVIAP